MLFMQDVFGESFSFPFVLRLSKDEHINVSPFDKLRVNGLP